MRRTNPVGIIMLILIVGALLTGIIVQSVRLHNTQQEYSNREANRNTYYTKNYTVTAELYAVKPNGTEIVQDSNGRLWEIEGLTIGVHDRLMLKVQDSDTVIEVWTLSWSAGS